MWINWEKENIILAIAETIGKLQNIKDQCREGVPRAQVPHFLNEMEKAVEEVVEEMNQTDALNPGEGFGLVWRLGRRLEVCKQYVIERGV